MGIEGIGSLRISPDNITHLNKDEIFVFGSNLQGQHGGGAARCAYERFGAEWGNGDGMTGSSYAIPTMHGKLNDIKPYVEKFLSYAKSNPQKRFLVTRIGCGIAGFSDREMSELFKEALPLPNVYLPRKWVELLLHDSKPSKKSSGVIRNDCGAFNLKAVRETDLVRLSIKYKKEISKGDKSKLPEIKIRYIIPEEERFEFAYFGDCFMLDSGDLYVFTDKNNGEWEITHMVRELFFDFEIERNQNIKRVLFAGLRTPYKDSNGDSIYTGDVLHLGDRGTYLALGAFGWNNDNMKARYAFVLDNHCLFPEDAGTMTKVGTAFYNLYKNTPIDVAQYCSSFQGGFPGETISKEEKLTLAMNTPSFTSENNYAGTTNDSFTQKTMKKIGRIKSWYVDPDDPNGRKVMYTTHNYLMVTVVDGLKFYAVLHDSKTDEDDAIALEIGDFELNGQKFNARFDDIRGNINYTNVSQS